MTKLDDKSVADSRALQLMIGDMAPGRNVRLTVLRDGSEHLYPVTLAEQPSDRGQASVGKQAAADRALDGVSLEPATPEFLRRNGVTGNTNGVAVRRVDPDSAAAQAGLQAGDVILEVNRRPVSSVEQVDRYMREGTPEAALLFVNRNGRTHYIAIPTR